MTRVDGTIDRYQRRRFPEPVRTPRLVIRSYALSDVSALFAAIHRSRPRLREFLPWAATSHLDESDTLAFVRRARERWIIHDNDLSLGLFHLNGSLAGGIGLQAIDWSVPRFELGYWLDNQATGQGLMREAVRAISRICFQDCGASRVEIRTDSENWKSAQVASSLGFLLDGTLRGWSRRDTEPRDTQVWGLTAADHHRMDERWREMDHQAEVVVSGP